MKILHSVLSLDYGGLEKLVVSLAGRETDSAQNPGILCIERKGELAECAEQAGVEVIGLDKPPGREAAATKRAHAILAERRPEVIHTHQIGAAYYLGKAARALKIPVIHTEHGNHFAITRNWLARTKQFLLYRKVASQLTRFCCVTQEIANTLGSLRIVPKTKLLVVANGIDAGRYLSARQKVCARKTFVLPPDALVVGTVGRLAEVKRQDRLLNAAAMLAKKHSNLYVLVVGDGPCRGELERLSQSLGMAHRTIFTGFLQDPSEAYSAMDVFALTSRTEGLPVSILESWASGVPVVSTAVGGIPNVIRDRSLGLLCGQGDEASLIQSIDMLLSNSQLRAEIAKQALCEVRTKYSLESMSSAYAEIYSEVRHKHPYQQLCAS